jgi:zinc transport system substrate-binding protein
MKKWISVFLVTTFLLMGFTGCSQKVRGDVTTLADQEDRVSIVATIFPQYDFAKAIAGDKADLTMLLKPGMEIHSYDPSPADIIKIENADVFIYIGGENDQWVNSILSSMDTSKMKIIKLIDCVSPVEEEAIEGIEEEHSHDEHEYKYDEHIWTSPKNAVLMVNAIADVLSEVDAKNAKTYRKNAHNYIEKIQQVDEEIQEIVESAPHKLLIFGDRFPFRYLTDEYGLSYRAAFNGCSTESEASAGTMAHLIDMIKENKISYIYYIELSNRKIAEAISEQTGAGMLLLHSCQNISKNDFEKGVTYVDLIKQNAENLKKGLN